MRSAKARVWSQQSQGLELESLRELLDSQEREVALPALDRTHIRTVDAHDVSEGLLRESLAQAIGPQIGSESRSQVSFHTIQACRPLRDGLHTYK